MSNNDAKESKLYIRSTDGLASQNFRIHRWAADGPHIYKKKSFLQCL